MWRRHRHQPKQLLFRVLNRALSTTRSKQQSIEISLNNGPPLQFSVGKLAQLASGSAVASLGSTSVLSAVVCPDLNSTSSPSSFLPLTVDYRQKASALGRIPTNHLRRELGPSEREILTSRLIDRAIRPRFAKSFCQDVQLSCNLMAVDPKTGDPDIVAMNAASAALSLSKLPFKPSVGAVRVVKAKSASDFIINPSRKEQQQELELNLVIAGDQEGRAVMMEADGQETDLQVFIDAVEAGLESCRIIANKISEFALNIDRVNTEERVDGNLMQLVRDECQEEVSQVFAKGANLDKSERGKALFSIRDAMINKLELIDEREKVGECFKNVCREKMIEMIEQQGLRVDGRTIDAVRSVTCQTGLHRPLHGSALFQRGETQVLCTVALDSPHSALKLDPLSTLMTGSAEKNFFLHYDFPGYATNEITKVGAAKRRELGHGALAERALRPLVPKQCPFTIRLTSEVLQSSGSSSMASVCGGSLALLDAGIALERSVAGVAMGLVTSSNGNQTVLTDILGFEDFMGDLDFKMAGTRMGLTALQADIKLEGISVEVIKQALFQGQKGIEHILNIMDETLSVPRENKDNLPVIKELRIPAHKRGKFVGPGGANLRKLTNETGVQITNDDGQSDLFAIFAPNKEAMMEADEIIEQLMVERMQEPEMGAIIEVSIDEIVDRGVYVKVNNHETVLIPTSQLASAKVMHPSALNLSVGETMRVKYFGRDPVTGSMRLSRKVLEAATASAIRQLRNATKR